VALADLDVRIEGDDDRDKPRIKEKPRIRRLPADQRGDTPPEAAAAPPADDGEAEAGAAGPLEWAYYKIVLQSPVQGSYRVRVSASEPLALGEEGESALVRVYPVLAAGRLASQNGHVAVAKDDTFALLAPEAEGLTPADPGSAEDLPHAPHRRVASLAFRHVQPEYRLAVPVVVQKEAAVIATMVTGALVEQTVGSDGSLSGRTVYLLATSRGDRLPITLPEGATLRQVTVNGDEVAVITGGGDRRRLIPLPRTAGQLARHVVEIAYGLEEGSPSDLRAPSPPEDVPVQQTLWRVWLPRQRTLLGFGRHFVPLAGWQADEALARMADGYPVPVGFSGQRNLRQVDLVRHGRLGELSLWTADRRVLTVIVWLVIVAGGLAMLRLTIFARAAIVLAVVAAAMIADQFLPLLPARLASVAIWPFVLVLILWLAHWAFVTIPRYLRGFSGPTRPSPSGGTSAGASAALLASAAGREDRRPAPPPAPPAGERPRNEGSAGEAGKEE
jgi:hypothetical protein